MFKSFVTSYAFTANYIIGIGILSLPTAMYQGGTILSCVFFFIVGWISGVFMLALAEITGRGAQMMKWKRLQRRKGNLDQGLLGGKAEYINEAADILVVSPVCETADDEEVKDLSEYDETQPPTFLFSEKFVVEITVLTRIFGGKVAEIIYFISVTILIFCAMWNHACVFIQSVVMIIPVVNMTSSGECKWDRGMDPNSWTTNCDNAYYIFGCSFMAIVTFISAFELKQQRVIQLTLTVIRFISITIMCVTSIIAMYNTPYNPGSQTSSTAPYYSDVPLANFSGFGSLVTMTLFAYTTHHSAPGILSLLGKRHANNTAALFNTVFMSIAGLYCAMSVCVSLYFGSEGTTVSTATWFEYNGIDFTGGPRGWWAYMLGYLVVLFPPLDLLSAFPLNAIAYGDNVRMFCEHKINSCRRSKGRNVVNFKRRYIVILFRASFAVLSCIMALFIRDVKMIVEISGLFAFVIVFFGPGFVLIMARKGCQKVWGDVSKKTPFDSWMTNTILIIVLCCLGAVALIYTIVNFCISGL